MEIRLSQKLLEHGCRCTVAMDEEEEEELEATLALPAGASVPALGGLRMRKAWTIGLQEASILHRNRPLERTGGSSSG